MANTNNNNNNNNTNNFTITNNIKNFHNNKI